MKPLVMWARINRGRLRIEEHTPERVQGVVTYADGTHERFAFEQATRQLVLRAGAAERVLRVDEMGVELSEG